MGWQFHQVDRVCLDVARQYVGTTPDSTVGWLVARQIASKKTSGHTKHPTTPYKSLTNGSRLGTASQLLAALKMNASVEGNRKNVRSKNSLPVISTTNGAPALTTQKLHNTRRRRG